MVTYVSEFCFGKLGVALARLWAVIDPKVYGMK